MAMTRMTAPAVATTTSSLSTAGQNGRERLKPSGAAPLLVPALRLGELSSPAFASLQPKPPLLVPVGIVEEHGAHLPLDTDSIQAVATCEEVAGRMDALVAPLLAYGNSSSTRNFPGSFSLRFDTLRDVARDILADCARHE